MKRRDLQNPHSSRGKVFNIITSTQIIFKILTNFLINRFIKKYCVFGCLLFRPGNPGLFRVHLSIAYAGGKKKKKKL